MATMLDAVINLKDNFSDTLKQIDNNAKNFSKTYAKMGRDIQRTGKSITKAGSTLTKGVTLPIVAIGAAAIKVGMDFEEGMSNVKAITGATASEMELLEKAARDAGANTSKSATEASEALGYMGLAGWSVKDSMDGLMPVLRLSEAGAMDLGRASDLVTDSMSAMGIEVKDLPKYLDVVAQTARSSNTDIDAMMEAYLGVGGVLKGLKVPVEESAVSIGLLANAGIKGAEGGKSLSSILTNLTAPTGRAKKALDELGFSAFDSQGEFKGMEEVLYDLQGKMEGMTTEEQNMYKSMIAGKEHIKGFNALMDGLGEGYDDLKGKIGDSEGALDEMAETMMDNAKGAITNLKSALEELGLKIFDILKPKVESITKTIQSFVDKLNNMSPEAQEAIVKFAMFAAAIGPVLLVIGKTVIFVGNLVSTFGKLGLAITKAGGLMAFLTGPGMIVVGVVVAIATAAVLLIKYWTPIKTFFIELWEGVKGTFNSFVNWIQGFPEKIGAIVENIKIWFTETLPHGIREGIDRVLEFFNTLPERIAYGIGLMVGYLSTIPERSIVFFTELKDKASETISNMIERVTTYVSELPGRISSFFSQAKERAMSIASELVEGVVSFITTLPGKISTIFTDVVSKVTEGSRNAYNAAIDWFKKIPEKITGFISDGIGKITGFIDRVKGAFTGGFSAGRNSGINGSHRSGLTRVPFDGYVAELHAGERVLTKREADNYNRDSTTNNKTVKTSASNITINIHGMTIREEADVDKVAKAIVKKIKDTSDNTP